MPIDITHWLRAFFALQEAASDGRGVATVTDGEDIIARWPRTTGDDVIAIAAILDPAVRAQPLRFGGHGVAQQWRAVADDLARFALAEGAAIFRGNEAFWSALVRMCVYLHSENAPLPPASQWGALLGMLSAGQLRNAGPTTDGPFKHFDGIKSFDDLYNAQFVYLRDLRGFDLMDPEAGMRGDNRAIPRTTNADVIALADYWDKQFGASRDVVDKRAAIASMWTGALADANLLARGAVDPNAVYPKNNGFWRAMKEAAIYTAVAEEAPTKWDLAKDALKESVTHLPDNLEAGASAAAKFVGGLAHEVGKVANEAGKGLLSGFGTPLLIGAGLLGLFFITRKHGDDTAKVEA